MPRQRPKKKQTDCKKLKTTRELPKSGRDKELKLKDKKNSAEKRKKDKKGLGKRSVKDKKLKLKKRDSRNWKWKRKK